MRLRLAVLIGAAAVWAPVGLVATTGCTSAPPPRGATAFPRLPAAGLDFRDIPVTDTEGRPTTLRAVLAGKPTLVSFWAPWCEPCVKEQPGLERLAHATKACGGAVIGVAVGESPRSIGTLARERGLTFPQLTDEGFALADAVGQRRIPAMMVVDGAGRIVFNGDTLDEGALGAFGAVMPVEPGAARCALR